jgi:hypothetical protein
MLRTLPMVMALLLSACSTSVEAPNPGVSSTPTPRQWRFLGQPSVDTVMSASDEYFSSHLQGDSESILAQAVAGAAASGWMEVRRKDFLGERTVFLNGTDGSQLSISVLAVGASVNLVATITPPQ